MALAVSTCNSRIGKGRGKGEGEGKESWEWGEEGGRKEGGGKEEEEEELCVKTKSNYYCISHFFKLNPTHHTEDALQ